jgi:hypothetical protein
MPDRAQQFRVDPRQPRQSLRIHLVILPAALRDQLQLPWVGHDYFVAQTV